MDKEELYLKLEELGLYPKWKKCRICSRFLNDFIYEKEEKCFKCYDCHEITRWNHNTSLNYMGISLNTFWLLLQLFTQNKSAKQAFEDMTSSLYNCSISEKTVKRYFKLFAKVSYQYYKEQHEYTVLEGHVEIDETQLYRMKKSNAPGRPYYFDDIWIIGFRERNSQRFLLFPTETRCSEFLSLYC